MRVEHLRDAMQPAKAVFLTPSHQFPTGATLALDRRLAVIEWVRQHQAWIIEGDYDNESTACVQRLDPHERTIDIGTSPSRCFPACALAT